MSKASITAYRDKLAALASDRSSESDNHSETGGASSLVPMLVGGLIMVVIGMLFVAAMTA